MPPLLIRSLCIPFQLARLVYISSKSLAVGQVHLKCNGMCYTKKDGSAMEASLAVKEIKTALTKAIPETCQPMENLCICSEFF